MTTDDRTPAQRYLDEHPLHDEIGEDIDKTAANSPDALPVVLGQVYGQAIYHSLLQLLAVSREILAEMRTAPEIPPGAERPCSHEWYQGRCVHCERTPEMVRRKP